MKPPLLLLAAVLVSCSRAPSSAAGDPVSGGGLTVHLTAENSPYTDTLAPAIWIPVRKEHSKLVAHADGSSVTIFEGAAAIDPRAAVAKERIRIAPDGSRFAVAVDGVWRELHRVGKGPWFHCDALGASTQAPDLVAATRAHRRRSYRGERSPLTQRSGRRGKSHVVSCRVRCRGRRKAGHVQRDSARSPCCRS